MDCFIVAALLYPSPPPCPVFLACFVFCFVFMVLLNLAWYLFKVLEILNYCFFKWLCSNLLITCILNVFIFNIFCVLFFIFNLFCFLFFSLSIFLWSVLQTTNSQTNFDVLFKKSFGMLVNFCGSISNLIFHYSAYIKYYIW